MMMMMSSRVTNVCRSGYYQLRKLCGVVYSTKTLVRAFIKKGKGVNFYSASSWTYIRSAQVWITQLLFCKAHHTCLYRVVRQRAPRLNEQS